MTSFFSGLWNSIFQPGASPQLILATHVSFIALLLTLTWLIFVTRGNIHFIALFVIATLLWLSIIWFIQELKNVRLMTNEELKEQNIKDNNNNNDNGNTGEKDKSSDSKSKKDEPTKNNRKKNDNNSVVYSSGISISKSKSRKV